MIPDKLNEDETYYNLTQIYPKFELVDPAANNTMNLRSTETRVCLQTTAVNLLRNRVFRFVKTAFHRTIFVIYSVY